MFSNKNFTELCRFWDNFFNRNFLFNLIIKIKSFNNSFYQVNSLLLQGHYTPALIIKVNQISFHGFNYF